MFFNLPFSRFVFISRWLIVDNVVHIIAKLSLLLLVLLFWLQFQVARVACSTEKIARDVTMMPNFTIFLFKFIVTDSANCSRVKLLLLFLGQVSHWLFLRQDFVD